MTPSTTLASCSIPRGNAPVLRGTRRYVPGNVADGIAQPRQTPKPHAKCASSDTTVHFF
jgi:hypothetical protein